MKILYCDCFSGISGDMFLSALLDAGMPLEHLRSRLACLNLPEHYDLAFQRISKDAVTAGQIEINMDVQGETHEDHDHHPYPNPNPNGAGGAGGADGDREHEHPHEHDHEHLHEDIPIEGHPHMSHGRSWSDIRALITDATLSAKVKETSLAIFARLAEAEGHVHGVPVEEVHFHEVGAVDSILDIVGAAVGLEYFEIERVYASALPLGSGQIHTQHGLLPVPAPATLELLTGAHAAVLPSSVQAELVTPTGAAILATLAAFEQPAMRLTGLGTGAGHRELPWPNILRLVFGEGDEATSRPMVQIETNIDDMNPQVFGHVMSKLFAAGALDVYFTPIQMKKNRPATMLSVIAWRSDEAALARLILAETTTMGMRMIPIYRIEADRRMETVQTEYGEIPLKLKILEGKVIQASPEYEVCARLAAEHGVPLLEVYQAALVARKEPNPQPLP